MCVCLRVACVCVRVCASPQVQGGANGERFSLTNLAQTQGTSDSLSQTGTQVVFSSFASLPMDTYYWVLPQSFLGDKVRGRGDVGKRERGRAGGREGGRVGGGPLQ